MGDGQAADGAALGERMRRERLRRKEKQADAAARFGISQAQYSRWEAGEYQVGQVHFANVAEYLGLRIEEVWALANGDATPTSLDALKMEVAVLTRDMADMREWQAKIVRLLDRVEVVMTEAPKLPSPAPPATRPAKPPVAPKAKPPVAKAGTNGTAHHAKAPVAKAGKKATPAKVTARRR